MPCTLKDAPQGQGFFLPSTLFLRGFGKRILLSCLFYKFIILLIELMIVIIAQRVFSLLYSVIFDLLHFQ